MTRGIVFVVLFLVGWVLTIPLICVTADFWTQAACANYNILCVEPLLEWNIKWSTHR